MLNMGTGTTLIHLYITSHPLPVSVHSAGYSTYRAKNDIFFKSSF